MKRLKILLVDDEPETGFALRTWLERRGYEATYVTGPAAADRSIASEKFDVILSDIQMPGNARLEWIEALLRHNCPPPVLLMTGDPQLETAMRAANLPIAGYLLKPLDYADTAAMIDRLGAQQAERREVLETIHEISSLLASDTSTGQPLDALLQHLKNLAQNLAELIPPIRLPTASEQKNPWHAAIVETITVLEKTKHSFHSRELGALRQRLRRLVPDESFHGTSPRPALAAAD